MAKLTNPQLDFLRAVAAGLAYRSASVDTLYQTYREDKPGAVRNSVVQAVRTAGLIAIADGYRPGRRLSNAWVITDAGWTVLQATTDHDTTTRD